MSNADKIQWSESAIRELQGRLTPVEASPTDEIQDVAIAGVEFPWPITVLSQRNVVNPDGTHSVQVVITWEDVPGAVSYEVRLANLA